MNKKLGNLGEIDTFLTRRVRCQYSQEERENLNKPITELVIKKKICTKTSPELDGFPGEFFQTFKEKINNVYTS